MATTEIIALDRSGFLSPVVAVKDALMAYQAKKELIDGIMKKGVDYGEIPGSAKPTLLKAGAEKATSFFGLQTAFRNSETVEDWTGEQHGGEPFFYYHRTCELWRNGLLIVSADGSCNSWEKKYRYRSAQRVCPKCGAAAILSSKKEPGFFCWDKKGGCGAKFLATDKAIVDQETGLVKNSDVADLVNTILKMADKRALVAATLIATGLSEYFTQDVEDYVTEDHIEAIAVTQERARQEVIRVASTPKQTIPQQPAHNELDEIDIMFPPAGQEPSTPLRFQPDQLQSHIGILATEYKDQVANDKQTQLAAAMLGLCFGGDETNRRELQHFLTGKQSMKEMSGPEIRAILKWLEPSKDAAGKYWPNNMSMREANAALLAARKALGQVELPA